MANDQIVEQVRRSIAARRSRSADQRWDELVERGAIDEHGKVILGLDTTAEKKPLATRKTPRKPKHAPKDRGKTGR